MAKSKSKSKSSTTPPPSQSKATALPNPTLSDLKADKALSYKILLLIHDLRNISKNPASERRLLQTTDELYISAPYLNPEEAATVNKALVEDGTTVEEAVKGKMQNFFEKRKASGDWRPCGSHDMVPVYLEVFGIGKEEIEDEKFLGRARRERLGIS